MIKIWYWLLITISQSRVITPAPINAISNQIRSYAADAKASPTEVSSILEQRIRGVQVITESTTANDDIDKRNRKKQV